MDLATLCKTYGIGLTGSIATGKSTVAKILREHGLTVVDADELSRKVVLPGTKGLAEVVKVFGVDVLQADGSLDRSKIRQRVFQDAALRQKLERIIHPLLPDALFEVLKASGLFAAPKLWIYEAPLLFEADRAKEFKETWCTLSDRGEQIRRLCARDRIEPVDAERIIDSQIPAAEKARRADVIIDTNGSEKQLRERVAYLLSTR